ncbi:hypothetical protein DFJ58DRAFT_842992 [Suillus subalutaceus]|uniref:uncharacterized protein n=1 Tax=Suillus subalutaceus TaxID=48586 RepID=UPI001B8768EF|nr:uncharacterized protein DFJ58DRAFT_842992 [Suillus subalutaceus]KAG1848054.1 hypothetical protein DFJ58DRAFT_842992 [Suillus subalutaceus]
MEGDNDRKPIDPPTNQDIVEAVVLLQKLKQFYLPPLIRLEQRLDSDSVGQRLQHMEQTLEPQPSERRQRFGHPEQSPIENPHWEPSFQYIPNVDVQHLILLNWHLVEPLVQVIHPAFRTESTSTMDSSWRLGIMLLSARYVTRQFNDSGNVPRSVLLANERTRTSVEQYEVSLDILSCIHARIEVPTQHSEVAHMYSRSRICGYSDPCGVIQNRDEGLFFRAISSFFALTGKGILTFENEGVNFLVRCDGMYNEIISSPTIQEKTLDVFDGSWSKKSWTSSNPFLRRQKAFDAVVIDLRAPMSGYTDKISLVNLVAGSRQNAPCDRPREKLQGYSSLLGDIHPAA